MMLKKLLKTCVGYLLLMFGVTGFLFCLWAFLDLKMFQAGNDSDPFGAVATGYVAIRFSIVYLIIAGLGWLILRVKSNKR